MIKPNEAMMSHYRVYMKAYGWMIVELAYNDDEIIKLINAGKELGPLMHALKERIEDSPFYE